MREASEQGWKHLTHVKNVKLSFLRLLSVHLEFKLIYLLQCLSWSLWLQCGDTQLLRVRELHRRLAFRPVGWHGVQLSASKSHFPGTASTEHVGFIDILYVSIYINFSLSLSPSFPCLCLMWFQAINKGPSRLPGSTVDIRIPNRLAGSGADMFHIIETQVDANSSLSKLFIQPKLLFISLFTCRQPHSELIYPTYSCQPCFSSGHSCLYSPQRTL